MPLCLPATKNHQSGLGASKDEFDAKIFSVLDSETGQKSAPPIQLELMPRQPQQVLVNADRVLVENNFDRGNVRYIAIKVFRSIFL